MSHHKKPEHHVRSYKLLAQTAGILICGFLLFLIVGQTLPGIEQSRMYDVKTLLPMVLLPAAGFLITYFNEIFGTVIIAIAALILFVYFSLSGDVNLAFLFAVPYLIVCGLFMLHIYKRKQLQKQ